MEDSEAMDLLRPALPAAAGGEWADLGAGTGTFTRALAALLGPGARIHAVDADERALRGLRPTAARRQGSAEIVILPGDFTRPLPLPPLDGMVMANALHFVRDQPAAVALAASYLRLGGRLVVIEYQHRPPNPWVPHPVSAARFAELAADAGLARPHVVARRPSAYGGEMYVAVAERVQEQSSR